MSDAPNVGADWPIWRLVLRGMLPLSEVDSVDALVVLDANEALDVDKDAEASAVAARRALAEATAPEAPGRR